MNASRAWVSVCVVVGLLAGTTSAVSVDFDGDGDVDASDFEVFETCATGSQIPGPPLGCTQATFDRCNLDSDIDVDQDDFGIFQVCYSGEGNPAGPNCAPPRGMVSIPAGEFQMGDSFNEDPIDGRELPVHAVYVDAFFMDRYEVTNDWYKDALNWAYGQGGLITVTSGVVYKYNSGTSYPYCSTTSAPTGYPNYGEQSRVTWDGSTFGVVSGKENHPLVNVTWYGSVAYANWRSGMQGKPLCYDLSTWNCNWGSGYRLPTEAEWEKAARGGVAGHRFPWSDSDYIQHARANYDSFWVGGVPYYNYDTNPSQGYHPAFNTGVYPYTSPVGYFAANGYGLYDMAGNVWEWCNDWYAAYSAGSQNNPHGPASGSLRVFRGGGWYFNASGCRSACRNSYFPYFRSSVGGFRLALDSD